MSKRKRTRTPARRRAPLNLRPAIDPKRPETWTDKPVRPPPKRDPVETWQARKLITGDEYRAAHEIERVFRSLTAGLWAKAAKHDARTGRPEMQEWLAAAYSDRYKPWADALDRDALAMTIDVVVDGWTLDDIAAARARRRQDVSRAVRNALRLYATMAGWQQGTCCYGRAEESEAA